MSFGSRMKACRLERGYSRSELATRLGVSVSAISNYENELSFPKEDVMLHLFDCLETEPNELFQDSFRDGGTTLSPAERRLLERYRGLSQPGRETVASMVETLCAYRDDLTDGQPGRLPRTIPLYRSIAAAGLASPVFGKDFDYLTVADQVPQTAELAVRIQGDSMAPYVADGSVIYVNRDPLEAGDVGIFCVGGEMVCKQYYQDSAGSVYLLSLNRACTDSDVVLPPTGGQMLICFGRVMMRALPVVGL